MLAKNINGARFSKNLTWALLALSPLFSMGKYLARLRWLFHKGSCHREYVGGIVAVSAAAFDNLPITRRSILCGRQPHRCRNNGSALYSELE